jgi:class 3 adenylate cyclase/predicted ATPase
MRCSDCNFVNPAGARFCGGCGRPLEQACTVCGLVSAAHFRYCGGCGAPLSGQGMPTATAGEAPPAAPQPERRQLTVVFCDLVDSTTLSQQLDPEDLRTLVLDYRAVVAQSVARYGGRIARYLGDGVMIYHGYPVAHEDDPHRAVAAAVDLVEGMRRLNSSLRERGQPTLSVRIGIHTGMVVAGDLGIGDQREPMAVIGDTPNIAARIEQVAAPDEVTISDATRRLVERAFVCRSKGFPSLKGIAAPIEIFAVERERRSDEGAGLDEPRSPLIGRHQDLSLLLDRWARVLAASPQAIALIGEPGIGKSRLLQEFRTSIAGQDHASLICRCSAHYDTSPFHPVIELLETVLALARDKPKSERRERLDAALARSGAPAADSAVPLAVLLDLATPEEEAAARQNRTRQKQNIVAALVGLLLAEAERRPVLFAIEDAHWADDSTIGFIAALIEQIGGTRIAVIVTSRGEVPGLRPHNSTVTQLVLGRLSSDETRRIIRYVAHETRLPAALIENIVERTDGVPLFIEELTKAVLGTDLLVDGAGGDELPPGAALIPMTLRDSLMAQLDQLPAAKPLAQLGAAIGRAFSFELIQALASNDNAFEAQLAALVNARFLNQHGAPPTATYSFRHALIQEAAYDSLLKEKRQQQHLRIATVLQDRFPDIAETKPEILAQHLAAAGKVERAIEAFEAAARRARERSGNVEAAAHYSKALDLVRGTPSLPERAQRELGLQVALGFQLIIGQGNAAPQVERAFERARMLSEQVGQSLLLFRALYGLLTFYLVRGRLRLARDIAERLLRQAESSNDPDLLIQAHRPLGLCLLYLGELKKAQFHLRRAVQLYDPQLHGSQRFEYISDPAVLAHCNLAWTEWFLGETGSALENDGAALRAARDLAHPHSLAFALSFAASLDQLRGDGDAALGHAEEVLALAEEHEFAYWRAWGIVLRGWALCRRDQASAGLDEIRRGLAAYHETGAELMRPYFLTLFAEALMRSGQREDALQQLDDAIFDCEDNQIRFYEVETLRLKAEITSATDRKAARRLCRRAIRLAREQDARALEIRALVGLYRLTDRPSERLAALAKLREAASGWPDGALAPELGLEDWLGGS